MSRIWWFVQWQHCEKTEFAVNNHVNIFTEMTFFVDHEYHSRNDVESFESIEKTAVDHAELLTTNKISIRQKAMTKWLIKNLTWAHADQMKYVNASRASHSNYKIEDWVYVNIKDFSIEKQSRFLNSKNADSWQKTRNIDNKARFFAQNSQNEVSKHSFCVLKLSSSRNQNEEFHLLIVWFTF